MKTVTKTKEKVKGRVIAQKLPEAPAKIPISAHANEAKELFASIRWDLAWDKFLEKDPSGDFKYPTLKHLLNDLVVGVDGEAKKRRVGILLNTLGPKEDFDLGMRIPYSGDWEAQRGMQFLGIMKSESNLFGQPKMAAARQMLKGLVEALKLVQACSEVILYDVARFSMWSQQIDELFDYKIVDPALPMEDNIKRMNLYEDAQRRIYNLKTSALQEILSYYGLKNEAKIIQQFLVQSNTEALGESTTNAMLSGLTGVELAGVVANGDASTPASSNDPFQRNEALKLIMGSFLEKAAIYNLPQPIPQKTPIPGIVERDDQELSLEELHKRRVQKGSKTTQ